MIKQNSILVVLFLLGINLFGQFYNGHQMTFGKNRVQYNNFYWSYYRYDDFDVYFNQNGKYLAQYTSDYLKTSISEIESRLDYRLDKRMIFVVFNKLTDLRQTNIGLVTSQEESNLGGVTTILKNKVFVYFNGDHHDYEKQLDASIAKIVLNEMLYGTDVKENVTNSTLINLPDWYIAGLVSFISEEWNLEIENIVKDGILSQRFKKFYHLQGDEALYAGHSFWKYISDTYGKSIIPDILYLTRIYKNPNQGFQYSIGMNVKQLSKQWMEHYTQYYTSQKENYNSVSDQPLLKRPRKKSVYHNLKISPTKDKMTFVTHKKGRFKIWLYDLETGKKKKIFKHGHNIEQITDYTFPAIAWHPTGKNLTFITEEKGGLKLYYYKLEEKELLSRNFLYFEKVLDYNFSHDGFKFVMSAVRNSQTDIFVYTLSSATSEQITNDIADDLNPRFINNSSDILFSSNRKGISLNNQDDDKTSVVQNLYIYDYAIKSNTLKKLETAPYSNSIEPYEIEKNKFLYLNDNNGVYNRYVASFDSVINFIDTTVHYRYVTESSPVTNYFKNINEQNYANNKLSETVYKEGRNFMFLKDREFFNSRKSSDLPQTKYRPILHKQLKEQDSINSIVIKKIPIDNIKNNQLILDDADTITMESWPLDITNYIFEKEKVNYYNEKLKNKLVKIVLDTLPEKRPRIKIYEKAFYPNYLVNQVDFQQTNTSYQAFTGGAVYNNPGMNMLFKVGTNDLFEDYRLIFGYRFSIDLESNEYLLSFENLKSRLDKQYIYHRQAFLNELDSGNLMFRVQTNEAMYVLRYPFNQVLSARLTFKARYDRGISLSINDQSLKDPNTHSLWVGTKGEFVFDNTSSLGMNLLSGSRWKIFGEAYFEADNKFSNLFVVGADYRYYLPIHRTLTWAFRFATSSSFGNSKLIYYLGSVDNWTNISTRVPTFDRSVPINDREKYAFQTTATNLRGFSQNIRNGNNFALINTEIRWPIIRYIVNRPVSNNFLNHLQTVGFLDIGSAWQGLTPYSGKNAYDVDVKQRGPVTFTIDSNREPIVAGYGFGFRTMLLGYFLRLDWAWGIENRTVLPRVFYLSLNLDF